MEEYLVGQYYNTVDFQNEINSMHERRYELHTWKMAGDEDMGFCIIAIFRKFPG